ncbi:hypothetical protein BHE74_00058553, partial [Ensete ventricosum]
LTDGAVAHRDALYEPGRTHLLRLSPPPLRKQSFLPPIPFPARSVSPTRRGFNGYTSESPKRKPHVCQPTRKPPWMPKEQEEESPNPSPGRRRCTKRIAFRSPSLPLFPPAR